MRIRGFFVFIFALCLLIALIPQTASAGLLPSAWAENELELARQWGLLDARSDSGPGRPLDYSRRWGGYAGLTPDNYADGITKDEFCQVVVTMCEKLTGRIIPAANVRFSDDGTPGYYYRAYAAGIINGSGVTADGAVIPGREERLSRQQVAKMLYQAIVYCFPAEAGTTDPAVLTAFSDSGQISSWAQNAATYMAQTGILKGVDGSFLPLGACTFEQGVVLAKRIYERFQSDNVLSSAPIVQSGLPSPVFIAPAAPEAGLCIQNGVSLQWQHVTGAARYLVRVERPGDTRVQTFYADTTDITIEPRRFEPLRPGLLSVSVAAVDSRGSIISPFTRLAATLYNDPDFYFDFASHPEAMTYMQTVTVKVWDIDKTGAKVTKTMSLTVHRWVAQVVIDIFDEIYNGPEQFPIHSLGGYRQGTSGEHPKGTAIDINWNENYEIYNDGRITCGTLWEPGVNPYSIPLDGDVVQAFRARGWGWGGTDWSKKQDYMHFSYFGT